MINKFKSCSNCNKKVLSFYIKKYNDDELCAECFKNRLINSINKQNIKGIKQ